jgi:hypothetical protein
MSVAMLPGITIAMAGREFTIPPLTLGQLRRLTPELGRIANAASDVMLDHDMLAAVVDVVTAALHRNYPNLDKAAVEDLLDLGNIGDVLNAVFAGSGLRRSAAPGEDGAAPGDGTSFTACSPPLSATVPATSTN